MNSNRRCSHCGELGHNSRTCQEGSVKLFGVNLNQDAQGEPGNSGGSGNLVQPSSSLEGSNGPRRDGGGSKYRASPLGREPAGSAKGDQELAECQLVQHLEGSASTSSAARITSPALDSPRLRTSARQPAVEDMEEQEGRSEHGFGTGADTDADGSRLLQTDERMLSADGDGYLSDNGGGPDLTASGSKERKKGVPWTEEEHRLFLLGLSKLGKGDWRGISRNFVQTRTPTQVASHAQKYFIRQNNINKRKRRASLLDISTDSINAETGMLRSHSTPSLPTLAEDVKAAGAQSLAGGAVSGSGLPAYPLAGTPSLPQPHNSSPGFSPPFGPNSPDSRVPDTKMLEHTPLYKAHDYMSFPATPTPSLYSYPNPHLYPSYPSAYQQDHSGFLLSGFRPPNPYLDFGRSQSYPVVGAPGVAAEVASMSRPNSLPMLGASPPVGTGMGGNGLEGVWPPASDAITGPYWSPLSEGAKLSGQDMQPLAAMDPALKHRLGHEMMMEMMGRQLSHRMAADYSKIQASTRVIPGSATFPGEVDGGRRMKVARGAGLHSAVMDPSMPDAPSGLSSPFMPPPLSSSPQLGYGSKFPPSMADKSATAVAAAAVMSTPAARPPQHGVPPPWFMGPAYNAWMTQYGVGLGPQPPGLAQTFPMQALPSCGDTGQALLPAQEVKPSSQSVLRPTAIVPTMSMNIRKVAARSASEGTATKDSEQDPAVALVMLSKGMEITSPGKEEKTTDVGDRETPKTLQLFDVSERPSAFQPKQYPANQVSTDSEAPQSPISVP